MKYISYFIFFGFIAALLLFLKNALEPKEDPLMITGSKQCGECHSLKMAGNQQEIWERSKHASAFKTLLTQKAKDFTAKNNIEEPHKNPMCLKCHTTGGFLGGEIKPSYTIEEGVGCEACHGAGSKYSPAEIMKDEALFKRNGGIVGDEDGCKKCHSPTANREMKPLENICPFQDEDFNYKTEFEKIKHPVNKENF